MKISILIVNWNGLGVLEKCLESIYKQTFTDYEVIVVDNASKDDSVKFIKSNYPQIKLIRAKQNLGFARGNNHGIQFTSGEYVLFLNNDTILEPDFLKNVIPQDKGVGMVAPAVLHMDGTIDSIGIVLPRSGMAVDAKDYKKPIVAPCGAAALYKREALEQVYLQSKEYFDEDFRFYCEDLDLGLRVGRLGWKLQTRSDARVFHNHSASIKKCDPYIQLLGHRNNILCVIKNFSDKQIKKNFLRILFYQIATIGLYTLKLKPVIYKLKWEAYKMYELMKEKRKIIQVNQQYDFGDKLV